MGQHRRVLLGCDQSQRTLIPSHLPAPSGFYQHNHNRVPAYAQTPPVVGTLGPPQKLLPEAPNRILSLGPGVCSCLSSSCPSPRLLCLCRATQQGQFKRHILRQLHGVGDTPQRPPKGAVPVTRP